MLQPDGRVRNTSSYSEHQTSFRHIPVADTAVWLVPQTGISEQNSVTIVNAVPSI